MKYGVDPYLICTNGTELNLNGTNVPEKVINAFLYKILLRNRREELKERILEGRRIWYEESEQSPNIGFFSQEDELLYDLMGRNWN